MTQGVSFFVLHAKHQPCYQIDDNNKCSGWGEVHIEFGGDAEGKGPLGRPRRRWENNIKIDLQEI